MSISSKENINIFAQVICNAFSDKNTTLEAFKKLDHLAQEVYSHAFAEDQEFERFCTPIVSTAAHSNLINKKHIAVFAVRALQDDELRAALVLLRNKKLFHFVSRSKLLHLFASPEQVEDLRFECLTQDLKLPFGTKEGTFAIELELDHTKLNDEPLVQFKIKDIGIGQNDHFQIPGIPGCFIADTIIDPNLADYLCQEFGAVNIRISQVEDKKQGALRAIACYAPTNHFPTVPCTFAFNGYQLTVQYKLPAYYDKVRVEVMNASEDARAHYENVSIPEGDPDRLSCIMPINHNTASFRRWQGINTAFVFTNNKEVIQQNHLQPEHLLRQENIQALATWLCAGIQSPVLSCHTTNLPHISILIQGELATNCQQRACVPQD